MHLARKSFVHLAALIGAALLTGCASAPPTPATEASDLTVKFAYKGIGIGQTAMVDTIELQRGTESRVASRAIMDAVQSMELGFLEPKVGADTLLPPGKPWTTDVLPIERASLDAYNTGVPTKMAVPTNREYGVQYVGEYAIVDRELRFTISAKLFQKGSSGKRHPYTSDYSGKYFVRQLTDAISAKLPAAPPPPPAPSP